MKKAHPSPRQVSAADSSAPAADWPVTAADKLANPQPMLVDDPEAGLMLAEDPLGNLPLPPEIVSPRLAQLETWDTPAAESGYRVAPQTTEDEAGYPEILVEEGADEAEEELRTYQHAEEQRLEREEQLIETAAEKEEL